MSGRVGGGSWGRWLVAVVASAAACGVMFTACSGKDRRLDALRSDPLARVDVPGALETTTTESKGSSGGGVPSPAQVIRTFRVDRGSIDAALDHLADEARAASWDLSARDVTGYAGEKTIDGVFAQLVIAAAEEKGEVWVQIYSQDE